MGREGGWRRHGAGARMPDKGGSEVPQRLFPQLDEASLNYSAETKTEAEAETKTAKTDTETETETEFEMEMKMEKFSGIAACHFVSLSHQKRRCLPTN